jgi:hypothetical protein
MHHAEAGRKAVPTINCHHRNDGEIDESRLGELPGYAALPYWQTDCLLVGVPKPTVPLSATPSHQTNVRFSDQFARSGQTGVHPQPTYGAYLKNSEIHRLHRYPLR